MDFSCGCLCAGSRGTVLFGGLGDVNVEEILVPGVEESLRHIRISSTDDENAVALGAELRQNLSPEI